MYKRTKYKRGEKQLLVLQFIDSETFGVRYVDIIRYAYELSHSKDSFDPVVNRGYWSGIFTKKLVDHIGIWKMDGPLD